MAKRVKESQPESGIVKVVDPLFDAPVDAIPDSPAHSSSRLRQGVRRFFEFLLRLVSWVIILGVIGGGLYYGLPLLYQRFVAPVEQNTAQMAELQSKQEQTAQELADLQTRLETIETGQSQNAESLNELDERVSELETEIAARKKSLAALEEMQSELQEENASVSAELQRQIDLLKAMELLSRARLFMYQSNFGLARQDIQIARDLLATLELDEVNTFGDDLDAVILRLDLTLSNLPAFPVAASDDLDIAWQILLSGLPQSPSIADATAVPAGSPSPTSEATLSPTPQTTVVPSATP